MDGKGSTDGDVSYLRVESFAITKGVSQDSERRVGAHKHGLAVCKYDLLFARTEFSVRSSDRRGIGGIQSNSCERHCMLYVPRRLRSIISYKKLTRVHYINNSNYHRRQSHRRQSSPSTFSRGLSG